MPRKGLFFALRLPIGAVIDLQPGHRLVTQTARSTRPLLLVVMAIPWLLAGCQVTPSPAWQTVQSAFKWPGQAVSTSALDPRFEYLGLTQTATSDYLALGYRSTIQGPTDGGHPWVVDHWYSARRELFVLEDGRLSQVLGTPLEWRAVRAQGAPRWHELLDGAPAPKSWVRRRDEMPGYRHDVVDLVLTRRVDAMNETVPTLPPSFKDADAAKLVWVRDDIRTTLADGSAWRHTQWFALVKRSNRWVVVWSRQCLAPNRCLDLQPVAAPAS